MTQQPLILTVLPTFPLTCDFIPVSQPCREAKPRTSSLIQPWN